MKWTRSELMKKENAQVFFDEDITIDSKEFEQNSRINGVKDVHVEGDGYLDVHENQFYANLFVTGTMLVPDAITGKEVEYPFETESEEVYSFEDTDEDGVRIADGDEVDLMPAIVDNILLEVPLQVSYASKEEYPAGDGWRVVSEEEYQSGQEERLDPRLAKLKEYKEE